MEIKKTSIDPKTCSEVMLYFLIDFFGGFIWRMTHDYSHGRIPEKDWVKIQVDVTRFRKEQTEAVALTSRFGVPEPVLDDKGCARPEYWQWYRHWDTWKKEMPEEQWAKVNAAGENVPAELLPPTRWDDALEECQPCEKEPNCGE